MKNILQSLMLAMLAVSLTARALPENTTGTDTGTTTGFVGLWEAVSPDDGAHLILSITQNDDSTFKLLLYSTFWTTCNGGRGLVQGTGKVSAEQSLTSDDFTLTCFETGQTTKFASTLTRNPDGTLTDVFSESAPPTVFHRTSK